MSEQDVEVVRRAFEGFGSSMDQGNPLRAFDSGFAAPDFKWILPANAPGLRSEYEGREGWMEFMRTWTEDFEWSIEIEELVDLGDGRVIVDTCQRAVGKGSGVPVELHMGAIWTVKDGQVVCAENFLEPSEARAAAGLSD